MAPYPEPHRQFGDPLTDDQAHRLYEALGTVAETVPVGERPNLLAVWRRVNWQLPDTDLHRILRGFLYRNLPDLVRADWRWIMSILPDPGARPIFRQWGEEAGYFRRTST